MTTTIMIDTGVANAILIAFIGGIGGILGAIAVWIQQRAKANSTTVQLRAEGKLANENAQADGYRLQEKASNTAIETLAEIAKQGVVIQQSMVDTVKEIGRTMNDNAAQLRGMLLMQETHSKGLRDVVANVEEVSGVIPKIDTKLQDIKDAATTLETNIGESIEGLGDTIERLFKPMADVLGSIETELKLLSKDSLDREVRTSDTLHKLIEVFGEARDQFMNIAEPFVKQYMAEIINTDKTSETQNGNVINEHSLPVKISIESKEEPK